MPRRAQNAVIPIERVDWGPPPFKAIPFLKPSTDTEPVHLTNRQRSELARIGTRMVLGPRSIVYREDSLSDSVFAISDGVVKTYRQLPSGKRIVNAFLFSGDLFGLAENGHYLNSAQVITAATLYRLPLKELAALLKRDAELQFEFLIKVTHELREAQRRSIVINRRDAAGRLAMFIAMMHMRQGGGGVRSHVVSLPMTRSDIAAFLGLSLESVSRAAARLEHRGLLTFEGRHSARILDMAGLAKLLAAL